MLGGGIVRGVLCQRSSCLRVVRAAWSPILDIRLGRPSTQSIVDGHAGWRRHHHPACPSTPAGQARHETRGALADLLVSGDQQARGRTDASVKPVMAATLPPAIPARAPATLPARRRPAACESRACASPAPPIHASGSTVECDPAGYALEELLVRLVSAAEQTSSLLRSEA